MTNERKANSNPLLLVVDDDAATRLLLRQRLVLGGFDVEEAEEGLSALNLFLEGRRPEMVLMDVHMPVMDGFAACTAIRRIPGGERVPVLMITALDDMDSINRAYAVGATDFITKPLNWTLLVHRVNYLLRSSRAMESLEASRRENRRLMQRSVAIQEQERKRLARELHDEMGQLVTAIRMDANFISDKAAGILPEVAEGAADIVQLSTRLLASMREITSRLRTALLDHLGLSDTLSEVVDEWRQRNRGVHCTYHSAAGLDELPEDVSLVLYRVLQESLTNIVKHAGASRVDVKLDWMALDTHTVERRKRPRGPVRYKRAVKLTIQDNGRGFDPQVRTQGIGLAGMRERLQALNGTLELDGRPGRGLGLTAVIPIADDDND